MIHHDWETPAFSRAPLAPATGPFPHRPFLETWWRHRADASDRLLLVDADDSFLPLTQRGGVVQFLGEADLTDYHSPLGGPPHAAIDALCSALPPGTRYRFDSLPAEAADALEAALTSAGAAPTRTPGDTARVLPLPAAYEEHLDLLGKKERHETRRKRRRFAAAAGEPRLLRLEGAGAVGRFAAMHRLSPGVKGDFMTAAMERFFADLHAGAGAHLDAVTGDDGEPVAYGFGFEDGDGYYLYNSAFDPARSDISPGAVLVTLLIERAIGEGRRFVDFLKGDEAYKLRLGAGARPLFALSGSLGAGR